MKRLLLAAYIIICIQICSKAQVVQLQWASKVIEVSSELTPVQYSAQQILGKPNVHPAGGQNPNAWTPDKPKRKEFIKVGFETPIQIQQIAIAESYNPSAVFKIYTYDEAGREYLIHSFNPIVVPLKSRMLTVLMEKTTYKVASVKLEFDGAALTDYFSIDAIAITDSNYPIVINIDVPDLLSKGLVTERLDENVNSEFTELNPILTPDGKTLYFSRKNHPGNVGGVNDKEDIWYSELGADGKWTLAKNMGPQFNNEFPNFVNAVSTATPDGKSVILLLGNKYLENGKMLAGISMSNNINGSWSNPTALEIENDYNYNEKSNYFMANTRKSLLMSIEREDSRGGRDLYVSLAKNDSLWAEPLNLGMVVNTSGEETSPFLATDDKTLYFSSNGFSGYGGSDIYTSTRLDDTWTNWSEPQNMGPDINSKLDDLFFNIPASSEFAYYSRGITEDNTDIFRVKLPVFRSPEPVILVKGTLIDSKTGKPIGATIIYERLSDGKEVGVVHSNPETGEYEILLPKGQIYGIRAEAKGHISSSQNLDLRDTGKDADVQHKDIALDPIEIARIEPDATINLNNIFFAFNKATLKPESFPELDRIVDLMKKEKTMIVEISGHTDSSGPDDYNMWLSEWRANAVAKYLIQKSIEKDHVKVTFFGETKPAVSNDTKAGRDKNRRVEFKILKM